MNGISKGMDVSPITGKPLDNAAKLNEQEKNLEILASAGLEAEQRLKSRQGKIFVALIEKELQLRIEEMVNDDPHSLALLRVLEGLGNDIQIGRAAVLRLSRLRLGNGSNTPL
jgi:hypothetical protein